jgi:hypothetical protein
MLGRKLSKPEKMLTDSDEEENPKLLQRKQTNSPELRPDSPSYYLKALKDIHKKDNVLQAAKHNQELRSHGIKRNVISSVYDEGESNR